MSHVPSRMRLHQGILAESRALREATSDWEVVEALRSWTYSHVCEQEEIEETLDQQSDFLFSVADAPRLFSAFGEKLGGVWCGGIGQTLRALYRMYGFESFIIDCGAAATGSTHISNLVRIHHAGRWLWTVQDAYYDVTYVAPDRQPLDIFDMLRLLKARTDSAVMTRDGPRNPRFLLSMGDEALLSTSWRIDPSYPKGKPEEVLPDGRLVFRTRPSQERLIAFGRAGNLFEVLRDRGYPEKLVYMYCLVFGVYPSAIRGAAELLDSMTNCIAVSK